MKLIKRLVKTLRTKIALCVLPYDQAVIGLTTGGFTLRNCESVLITGCHITPDASKHQITISNTVTTNSAF